jgi:ketosteroid isomerase-like protein
MYKWAVRHLIRRNIEAMRRGDCAPLLSGYADNAVLVFPGQSSWSGEHRGTPAIEAFLRRFLAAGLHGEAQEILVNGPPWRTRVCVVFTDRAEDAEGTVVYENRVVLFGRAAWGKVWYQEDFLDTHKVAAFDEYAAAHGLTH